MKFRHQMGTLGTLRLAASAKAEPGGRTLGSAHRSSFFEAWRCSLQRGQYQLLASSSSSGCRCACATTHSKLAAGKE